MVHHPAFPLPQRISDIFPEIFSVHYSYVYCYSNYKRMRQVYASVKKFLKKKLTLYSIHLVRFCDFGCPRNCYVFTLQEEKLKRVNFKI